jgi:hypothetical protein
MSVRLITHSRYKHIQYIQNIDYRICEYRKADIYNDCKYWTVYSADAAAMSGRYKLLVTWADGSKSPLLDLDVRDLPPYSPSDPTILKFEIKR